jgi:hypothetical protein
MPVQADGRPDGLVERTTEIAKRSDAANGFVLLPRRWTVERTVAWFNRNRRAAKDVEADRPKLSYLALHRQRQADAPPPGCRLRHGDGTRFMDFNIMVLRQRFDSIFQAGSLAH